MPRTSPRRWWAGERLWEIDGTDWRSAVDPATAHMAVLRACLPWTASRGACTVVVGASASHSVPRSGLASTEQTEQMEQAALLIMQQVAQAELEGQERVFALVLGPVRTRLDDSGDPDRVSAEQVRAVTVAAAAAVGGREIRLTSRVEVNEAPALLPAGRR